MHRIELSRQAAKELEKVFRSDKRLYQRFVSAFGIIARDPTAEGKPLQGELKGLRSYRFGGYRILYETLRGELRVIVIDLGHRRDIYR